MNCLPKQLIFADYGSFCAHSSSTQRNVALLAKFKCWRNELLVFEVPGQRASRSTRPALKYWPLTAACSHRPQKVTQTIVAPHPAAVCGRMRQKVLSFSRKLFDIRSRARCHLRALLTRRLHAIFTAASVMITVCFFVYECEMPGWHVRSTARYGMSLAGGKEAIDFINVTLRQPVGNE